MAKEIERKFLVDQGLLPKNIIGEEYIQAYIAINDQGIVRRQGIGMLRHYHGRGFFPHV